MNLSRSRIYLSCVAACLLAAALRADTLTLKGGQVLTGKYLGGNTVVIRFDAGAGAQVFDAAQVETISFAPAPAPAAPTPATPTAATPAIGRPPKVGLVLGGGGALGLAHVGVLRVLEKEHIPIDYIAGTSMGSIVGGLYASGMSPDEIETVLREQDWKDLMSDKTPRRELFFRRKTEDQRYMFEIGLGIDGFKAGSGMAAGQKFNNLMQYLTLRSASITNFDQLPIPYRAVATDLTTGEAYVIKAGNLSRAMRASMAVPGAFTPVELDGRILVDGGVVDNLPVDVMQKMGADIIIAVDVGASADKVTESELKTIAGVLGRTYAVAQRRKQLEMFRLADVGIQPELDGFTATEFERGPELVPLGEKAAQAKVAQLRPYRVGDEQYAAFLAKQRHANPAAVPVSAIAVTGNHRVSEAVIRGRIQSQPGAPFDQKAAERDLERIYGVGEFEQILCQFSPNGDGSNTLTYAVTEKSWGPLYFRYGLKLESDFKGDAQWGMLLNFTRLSVNDLGAEWRNELELGSKQDINSEFYQPLDSRGFLFVSPGVEFLSDQASVYQGKDRTAEYDVMKLTGRLDFGLQLRDYAELRVGPFWETGRATVSTGAIGLPKVNENAAGGRVRFTVDRQDRTVFARQGSYFLAEGTMAREAMGGNSDYDKVSILYRGHESIGNHTLSAGLQYGSSLGSDVPIYSQFVLGGVSSFAGLAEGQVRGSELLVGSVGHRYRLLELPPAMGRGLYTLTRLDIGNVWASEHDVGMSTARVGALLGLGADTSLGPIFLGYGVADGGYDCIYFSLGNLF